MDFLIGEFQDPLDSVESDDYSMYEYRSHLLNTACVILGIKVKEEDKEQLTGDQILLDEGED